MGKVHERFDFGKVGEKFGRLTAVGPLFAIPGNKGRDRWCVFQCDCGTYLAKRFADVKCSVRSCGCGRVDAARERWTKHGAHNHPAASSYYCMMSRCYKPKACGYQNYGGRGIVVCDEWRGNILSFVEWADANGHKPGLEIDRIDNDGNYEPGNCRFVEPKQNCRNRRSSKRLIAFGETKTLAEWAEDERSSVDGTVINFRLRAGWSPEDAVSLPSLAIGRHSRKKRKAIQ